MSDAKNELKGRREATLFDLAGASTQPELSFEFFPPSTPEMEQTLWTSITELAPLAPRFVSVTYGAGGTTRERTHATVTRIRKETDLEPAAHLTCVGAEKGEIDEIARRYWNAGIRHVVALRGDPPKGESRYRPHPGGYANAAELVAGLKRVADFEISVAAYPEVHPDSANRQADLDNLKRKLDAGATRAITQFFFDPECFLRFRDKAAAAGIGTDIVPGILPVSNFARVNSFAKACGAAIPKWLERQFEGLDDQPKLRKTVAAIVACEQCRILETHGVTAFHFYTLNRADLVTAICRALGRPAKPVGDRDDKVA